MTKFSTPHLLLLTTLLFLAPNGWAADGVAGTPGVEDGECFKNSNTGTVSVSVVGTVHGDQNVKVTTSAGTSTTGSGTPDPDGGCADSSTMTSGTNTFKVDGGKLKYKTAAGHYASMTSTKCPDDDDDDKNDDEPLATNSVGSLPDM